MKLGMIGAGSIAVDHLKAFAANPNAEVVAIADVCENLAKGRAETFNIAKYYTDYKELLKDESIDAVSIATPTFTHTQIVCDALNAGKHVLCEKPPALTAAEVQQCVDAAKKAGKVLMYGLVLHFADYTKYLKEFADKGGFGKIYAAEATRRSRCTSISGWFVDKKRSGGGMLMDAAIHEIDLVMYLMGYPKPKSILAYTSNVNADMPKHLKGGVGGWKSATGEVCDRTVESMANGFVTFENGACLTINTSHIQFAKAGRYVEVSGDKAGARVEGYNGDLSIARIDELGYMSDFQPSIAKGNAFQGQMDHFVDCCVNGTECLVKAENVVTLMTVMENLYKSAELGKAIEF